MSRIDKTNKVQTARRPCAREKITVYNGTEFKTIDNNLISVKLPNGISVNFDSHTIGFDICTHWHINKDLDSVFKTRTCEMFVDPDLHATKYSSRGIAADVSAGDNWLMDNRYRVSLDAECRVKQIKFRRANNAMFCAEFTQNQGQHVMVITDGTIILFNGRKLVLRHNGVVLGFDNCQEFAATYNTPTTMLQHANGMAR